MFLQPFETWTDNFRKSTVLMKLICNSYSEFVDGKIRLTLYDEDGGTFLPSEMWSWLRPCDGWILDTVFIKLAKAAQWNHRLPHLLLQSLHHRPRSFVWKILIRNHPPGRYARGMRVTLIFHASSLRPNNNYLTCVLDSDRQEGKSNYFPVSWYILYGYMLYLLPSTVLECRRADFNDF